MIGATLFSGIGAPETAMPEWQWIWAAEHDPEAKIGHGFAAAVLAARHPDTPNLGDVTADDFVDRAAALGRPDVLVFGSPCQDFSVAGKRLGMDGARGNLALVALGIVDRLKPRWFVFENVPGLLSNWSGAQDCPPDPGSTWEGDENHDFAAFLGAVDGIGYSGAWAVLDAQYRGLAQRRARLFFVGYLGDWRGPAAVLLEPESLCGDTPPRREAGKGVAPTIAARTRGGGGLGTDFDCDGGLVQAFGGNNTAGSIDVATAVNAHGGPCGRMDFESETFVCAPPLTSNPYGDHESREGLLVAHSLRADGFDASEDGTGRGTPLVPSLAYPLTAGMARSAARMPHEQGALVPLTAGTMKANNGGGGWSNSADHAAAGYMIPVAFSCKDHGADCGEIAPTLRSMGHDGSHANAGGQVAVAFDMRGREGGAQFEGPHDTANIRAASGGSSRSYVAQPMSVRRLMPTECEALQGFRRGYTDIIYRGKPVADGNRYKALGNSMAVPVLRFILQRIEIVDGLIGKD